VNNILYIIDAFKKAIEIKPGFHEAYRGIGFAYLKLKKYQKAIDAFKKAIEINPDDDEVKHYLQRALRDLKGQ
jgi:tetratricopeptide (TPR) repeat protein